MADTDTDTDNTPEKKGGGFVGVVGGAVGAVAGGVAASHIGTGERLTNKLTKATTEGTPKLVEQLTRTKEIVAQEGFLNHLKRPAELIAKGTTGRKLAIVGGAVALGGATYAGIRAIRNRGASESNVDMIEQQRAAAAADQTAGKGVA